MREDWPAVLRLRDACLAATEETGRQLWGPARFASYRVALDGPAELAASMLEPGVVRFGLGPLTEVVAQHHPFVELAPHLDSSLLAVVAQERVLRGEDLREDGLAVSAMADSGADVPLVLQSFEPAYALPDYRADSRVDGGFLLPDDGWTPVVPGAAPATGTSAAGALGGRMAAVSRALHDSVEPWTSGSDGVVELVTVQGGIDDAVRGLVARLIDGLDDRGDDVVEQRPIGTAPLFGLVAFAAASGGVHGRRRGAAAGRASAWWLARAATGLEDPVVDPSGLISQDLVDELEFRLEDLLIVALRVPRRAAWRLELALADAASGWAVAVAAFDLSNTGAEGAEDVT